MAYINFPPNAVNPPSPASYNPPQGILSQLIPDFFQGAQLARQNAQANAFSGGVPTNPDGSPNLGAMGATEMRLGNVPEGLQLYQAGLGQQQLNWARGLLGNALGNPSPTQGPSAGDNFSGSSQSSDAGSQNYYAATAQHESSGGAASDNVFQFSPPTWAAVRNAYPDLNLPSDVSQASHAQQIQAAQALTNENAHALNDAGVPISDKTLYMAHFLGGAGAVKFFGAYAQNPNASAPALFPAEAQANPTIFFNKDGSPRSLAQVYGIQTQNFSSANTSGISVAPRNQVAGPGAPVANPSPTGGVYVRTGQPRAVAEAGGATLTPPAVGNLGAAAPGVPTNLPLMRTGDLGTPTGTVDAGMMTRGAPGGSPAEPQGTSPSYAENLRRPQASDNRQPAQAMSFAPSPGPSPQGGPLVETPDGRLIETDAQGNAVGSASGPSTQVAQAAPPVAPQAAEGVGVLARGGLLDPTMGGIVPKSWIAGGGTAGSYLAHLYAVAAALSANPYTAKMAEPYLKQAEGIESALRTANTPTPESKAYEIGRLPGESLVDFQARQAAAIKQAQMGAENANTLEKVQPTPGGPTQYETRQDLINQATRARLASAAAAPGGDGAPPKNLPVAEQPAWIADRQKAIQKDEEGMATQYDARQIGKERIGELANILEEYQTGALANAYADAQRYARAVGIDLPNTAQMNAADFQKFTKNAIANVFQDLKSIGGRPMVAEIQGLMKANANPELEPEAAAKILAQGAGLINWADRYYEDYTNWRARPENLNTYNTAPFHVEWMKGHPASDFTGQADKEIAPLGAKLPTPDKLVVDQVYRAPDGRTGRWDGQKFAPVTTTAAQRLFGHAVSVGGATAVAPSGQQ